MFLFFLITLTFSAVLTPDDLVRLQRLTFAFEHNGNVYYTSSQWNSEENKTKHALWKTTIGGEPIQIRPYTVESLGNFVVIDNTIYLLYNGAIAIMNEEGEIIKTLSDIPVSIDSFKMIKVNGKLRGLCQMTVFPGKTLEETVAEMELLETKRYRIYDDLMIRRWDTYWDGQFQHLFTFEEKETDKLTFTDIMNDLKYDCPARPFGGNEEYDISPDGKQIAFSILMENVAASLNNNVYIVDFDTPQQENWVCITSDNKGYDNQPQFSADGTILYYLSMDEEKDESDKSDVMKYNLNTKKTVKLTANVDLSFTAPYIEVNHYLHLSTQIRGNSVIVGFDATKDTIELSDVHVLTPNGSAGSFKIIEGGFIYEYNNYTLPNELFFYNKAENKHTQFTFINKEKLDTITFGKVGEMTFKGAYDDEVHAFINYPPNMEDGKKYPTILYTHGGPESPWSNNFHYRWNPQVISAQGYIVLSINFHGSGSYGDAFLKAIRSNWGGAPFEDLMKGIEAFSQYEKQADTTNMCAMGASYGGYMMNWLNSQKGDMFKCIICHDGIIDAEGSYYYMDEMYFLEVEFGNTYYDDNTNYVKWSPLNYIQNYKAPQLTLHGGTDYRIDVVAGYQQFVTLQRKGVESKLVVYPEENHWVLRPFNSLDWHNEVFTWLDKYLNQKEQ